jgi:hypothetical protein
MWTVLFADKCGTSTASKPKPTPRPTPRPVSKAQPKPAAKATPRPTPAPLVTPTPLPTPTATSPLAGLDVADRGADAPRETANEPPADEPGTALRVVESGTPGGLVDTIVGGVTGMFFGA